MNNYKIFEVKVSIDNKYMIENNNSIKILETDYSLIGEKVIAYKIAINTEENIAMIQNISKEIKLIAEKMM